MIKFQAYKRPTLVDMGVDPVREALLNELRSIGRAMSKDLSQVFLTWEKKPKVEMKIHLSRTDPQAGVEVYVEDPIAHMLNVGTERHYVAPVRKPRLAWQAGFKQKTTPRSLSSQAGGKYGNDWRTSMGHWIKGVEARKWDETLAEKWDKEMGGRLQTAAMKGAAKARRI
jgi:hypothetical protein